jgi:hypothetical protein
MAYAAAGYIITKGVDTGLIGTVASGITTMTSGIYHLVVSIGSHENVDVNTFLEKLDIQYKMKLIEAVLDNITEEKQIADDEFTVLNSYDTGEKNPLGLSLHFLSQSIQKIQLNLDSINKEITTHKQKWFNGWRSLSIKPKLQELERNTEVLSRRFDDFLKIAPIVKKN